MTTKSIPTEPGIWFEHASNRWAMVAWRPFPVGADYERFLCVWWIDADGCEAAGRVDALPQAQWVKVTPPTRKHAEHVAWARYAKHEDRSTTIHLCDSDEPGAFPVYRNHADDSLPVQTT